MIRDRDWLDFIHYNMACCICGIQDETICGHHIRSSLYCGTALKPSDNFCIPVCYKHHAEIHQKGEKTTLEKYGYTIEEMKDFANSIYERYKKLK